MTKDFKISRDLLKDWTIAVVDDEPDSLRVVEILLEQAGATVITAKNGEEGLKLIQENKPRFVISDLAMPKMNGHEMVKQLKNRAATRDIPVIGLSAYAMPDDRDAALKVGFHGYIVKPLNPERFVNQVLNLLLDVPELAEELDKRNASE